jgi:hypothetical protein
VEINNNLARFVVFEFEKKSIPKRFITIGTSIIVDNVLATSMKKKKLKK